MKWREIASRLNGVSVGPFSVGAQWTAKPSDAEVARRVIRFLGDRRILYNECAQEEPGHCIQSALDIRRFLTGEIVNLKDPSDILQPLRAIRAACRKFLDQMQFDGHRLVRLQHDWENNRFFSALGEFRGSIGPHVACLAVRYEIDVETELARVLPVEDVDGL